MPEDKPATITPGGPPPSGDLTDKVEDKKQGADEAFGTNVVLSEGNSPMELDTAKRTDPKNQYIKYTGFGTVRTITPDDWKAANVDSDDYCEWNYLNHKMIPRSAFTDEQLQYLLRVDGRFELVTVEPEPADK